MWLTLARLTDAPKNFRHILRRRRLHARIRRDARASRVSALIRDLGVADAAAVAAIYNDAVAQRVATFDVSAMAVADIAADLRASLGSHPAVAIDVDGVLAGYAVSAAHSDYAPYRGIAEFSVYVAHAYRGRGFGRLLLGELVERCRVGGFTKLLSRILAENVASRGLCAAVGFREVGMYEKHARLDGVWRDVVIVERLLQNA